METSRLFLDLAVVLAIATVAAVVFSRLRISVIPAFLIAGAALGPSGLGLVAERGIVQAFAEIGVAMFLFVTGLDVPISRLGKFPRKVLWAGVAQIVATVALTVLLLMTTGLSGPVALLCGFIFSLSSTAIVLKEYANRMETETTHGRVSFGILLVQDFAAIPMMLMVPVLAGWGAGGSAASVAMVVVKAVVGVGVVFFLARFLIPRLIKEVVRLNVREVLALTVLMIVLGTAFLARKFGLPLGMGAFLAGMVIAESEYVHEIAAQIFPLSDVFNGVSYVSVGMLLQLPFLWMHLGTVVSLVLAVVIFTMVAAAVTIRWAGVPWRIALVAAIGISQIGELSFLLIVDGFSANLLSFDQYEMLMAITVLSMIATPFLIKAAPGMAGGLIRRFPSVFTVEEETKGEAVEEEGPSLENHVVIAGYGMNGRNLSRVLKATRLPYVVIDLNDAVVEEGRAAGEPVFFGDIDRPMILERVGIRKARIFVVALSDPMATRRAVALARRISPTLFILARTRYVADVDDLIALGANAVIPEEFETSVEIFARVLAEYHVPDHVVRQQEQLVRSGAYRILRERKSSGEGEILAEFEEFLRRKVIEVFFVAPGCGWEGRTVGDLPLDEETGIVLLAVLRDDRPMVKPPPSVPLVAGDKLVLFGGHAALAAALSALSSPP